MAEQERTEAEGQEQASAAESQSTPEAKPEQPEAAAPAPKAEKAEAKEPEKPSPPPGGIADLFREALPGVQMEAVQGITDVIIEIARDDVPKVMQTAKDDPRLDLKFLRCLFGVDHSAEGMDVIYQLLSYEKGHEVVIKTHLQPDNLRVASVTGVWKGANWHERETRDMFGIEFEGHPHLVPLLLPEDMTDHYPLRKDNVLAPLEDWQGELLGQDMGSAGHIPPGSGFDVEASAEGE
ncbi:MAG: NADH-quinone oxidoreductase subunit C [Dehalococcoidia bacterium]